MQKSSDKVEPPEENSVSDTAPTVREDLLTPIQNPELFFGLVGPIGTDLATVFKILSKNLSDLNYRCEEIKITSLLDEFEYDFSLKHAPIEERYDSYINAGNMLRERLSRQDAFALLSVGAIRKKRRDITGDSDTPLAKQGVAYILNQFKRPEEIETLRSIYGHSFIQISAYCSKLKRLHSLVTKIASDHSHEKKDEAYMGDAYKLILRDAAEEEQKFGQRVRDAFPLADVIINASNENSIRKTLERFVRAFFSDNFITPNIDEYGSFLAKTVSLRSSDLSRQVGAVALTKSGEIITAGCNEVPKGLGGTYWTDDEFDMRDFQLGYDPSVEFKKRLVQDLLRRLREEDWLKDQIASEDLSNLVKRALFSEEDSLLKEADVMNILEYGRVVHAEMSVIADAARLGRSLKGATLYCTTFPCHICARHIVASGIDRVVYIEPYAKSLAADLYPDSISVEGEIKEQGPKITFDHFVGIAPQRFAEIFHKKKRKDKYGKAIKWQVATAKPIVKMMVPVYLDVEKAVSKGLLERMEKKGLRLSNSNEPVKN